MAKKIVNHFTTKAEEDAEARKQKYKVYNQDKHTLSKKQEDHSRDGASYNQANEAVLPNSSKGGAPSKGVKPV
jgi:hypothetical protein